MKNFIKSLIKIVYVVILPIALIVLLYNINQFEIFTSFPVILAFILITVAVVANSIIYMGLMSKVKMFPNVSIEFHPLFGLAVALDRTYNNNTLMIIIPFAVIEILLWERKNKK
jgi:hypothetical protein